MSKDAHAFPSFPTFLAAVEDGDTARDLTNELHAVVKELSERVERYDGGKPTASISLKLTLTMDARKQVVVKPEVNMKLPKTPRSSSLFWATEDGKLTARNPNQPDMFKTVEAPPAETRTATD